MTEEQKRRVGRPTNDPKETRMSVSFNAEQAKLIKDYSQEKNVSKAEAVRHGVNKLKDELK
ncbi:hypothetical protein [Lactococcus sp. DD01]|uniref:hypothetical protein n=1 Tax=Lactococcus sp. DD01 TaxID=1776443 RepID=UPI0007765B34|nr:hypothetical protein [Lactococcus sp. DD01]